jgi:hypothetical protein
MMHRLFVAVLVVFAAAATASAGLTNLGVTVPPPPGAYRFTALAADGVGDVFAYDSTTLYRLQGGAFQPYIGNIPAKAWPSEEVTVDPSGFAVNRQGTVAYIATGGSGRIVEVNLDATSTAFGAARELTGASCNANNLTSNYGIAVDPIYGRVFMTDSYSADLFAVNTAGNGSLTLLKHFATGLFGSGIAFSPGGELTVPVATAYAAWPNSDTYPTDLWRFSRAWLDDLAAGQAPADTGTLVAAGRAVSGTGFSAASRHDRVFLQAADGIYEVDAAGHLSVLVGDTSQNAFDLVGSGYMGLTYDAAGDRLLFAYRDSPATNWQLYAYTPEPATLGLVAAGLAGLGLCRRRQQ